MGKKQCFRGLSDSVFIVYYFLDSYLLIWYFTVMAGVRWTHTTSRVEHAMRYRFAWCTKYMRPVLSDQDKVSRLLSLIRDKCLELDLCLISASVDPDRVVIDITAGPTACPHWIITQIRHYTSHKMREEYRDLKTKLPTLWTRPYYCVTLQDSEGVSMDSFFNHQKGV